MIISVMELKKYITTDVSDAVLKAKLDALELLIRKYTNNNFQDRRYRTLGDVSGNNVEVNDASFFNAGDTIMVDNDLCVIEEINGNILTVNENLLEDERCIVTKVVYPADVKMGVIDMLKWDLENRDKVGIQSETISRHSVTYFDTSADIAAIGFPNSLIGFLKLYKKARF